MRKQLLATFVAGLIPALGIMLDVGVSNALVADCNTTLSGSVSGPVVVPNGSVCKLVNATVGGAVNVKPGGRLEATNSTIRGVLNVDGGTGFVCGGSITDSVRVKSANGFVLTGGPGGVSGCASALSVGTTSISTSTNPQLVKTQVRGSVSFDQNTNGVVGGNTISGHLKCSGNTPVPSTGGFGPNAVSGYKTGQCSGL